MVYPRWAHRATSKMPVPLVVCCFATLPERTLTAVTKFRRRGHLFRKYAKLLVHCSVLGQIVAVDHSRLHSPSTARGFTFLENQPTKRKLWCALHSCPNPLSEHRCLQASERLTLGLWQGILLSVQSNYTEAVAQGMASAFIKGGLLGSAYAQALHRVDGCCEQCAGIVPVLVREPCPS
jgi:hypothetical protein